MPQFNHIEQTASYGSDIFPKKEVSYDVNLDYIGDKVPQSDFIQPEINQLFLNKDSNYMAYGNGLTENEIFGFAGQNPNNVCELGSPSRLRSLSPKERYLPDVHHEHQPTEVPPMSSFENQAKFMEDHRI